MAVKFDEFEVDGRVDLGPNSVSSHIFTPYVSATVPRSSVNTGDKLRSFTLGGIFHIVPESRGYWGRVHLDLHFKNKILQMLAHPDISTPRDLKDPHHYSLLMRHCITIGYGKFILSWIKHWLLTESFKPEIKISLGLVETQYNGYLELGFKNTRQYHRARTGVCWNVNKAARVLGHLEHERTSANPWRFALGGEYQSEFGLGVKAAYYHHEGCLKTSTSYRLNSHFQASLFLDVSCCL